jgi:hypothetical protein
MADHHRAGPRRLTDDQLTGVLRAAEPLRPRSSLSPQ